MSSEKDLEQLGDDYYNSLLELTFNSRPIITTLTILAQENIPAAKYITNAVVKRINKCVPAQKLFALYLLDSICKNIGHPYTLLFSQNLSKLFIDTYTLVDDAQRKKMIDLFKTWKNAKSATGLPLFPAEPLQMIEKFLTKVTKSPSISSSQASNVFHHPPQHKPSFLQPPPSRHQPSSSQLINDIENLQAIINRRLAGSPGDQNSVQKLAILNQLKMILSTQQLNPTELASIQNQLQGITNTEKQSSQKAAGSTPTPPPAAAQPNFNNNNPANVLQSILNGARQQPTNTPIQSQNPVSLYQQLNQPAPSQQNYPHYNTGNVNGIVNSNNNTFNPTNNSIVNSNPLAILNNLNLIANKNNQRAKQNNISINGSQPPLQNSPIDLNTLVKTLQTSGLLRPGQNDSSPAPQPAQAKVTLPPTNNSTNKPLQKPLINLPSTSILQNILFKTKKAPGAPSSTSSNPVSGNNLTNVLDISDFQLTNSSISAKSNDIGKFQKMLYDTKPIKCNNCGKRFNKKEESQKHLDWHFRINKRLKDASSINTRSYYLSFESFVHFKESEILGNDGGDKTSDSKSIASNDTNTAGTLQSGSKSNESDSSKVPFIVIPNDCIDMSTTCNICKDTLKGVWNDELGEWIWNNAVQVNNKIYHHSCYNETQRNSSKDSDISVKRKLEDGENDNVNKKPNLNGLNLNLDILKSLNLVNVPGSNIKN